MSKYFNCSGTIGFTCDKCGREMQGCTWVNGMKFCADCYQETFVNSTSQFVDLLNKEMYELKIADLEAKLAEKDQTIETIIRENEELVKKHNVYTWEDEIQQGKIYAITGEALEFLISNQDKISFAVDELEKAREMLFSAPYKFNYEEWLWVEELFDNQIKQLKEKNDV